MRSRREVLCKIAFVDGWHDCEAITRKNAKTLETTFYSPSTKENKIMIARYCFVVVKVEIKRSLILLCTI